MPRTSESIIVVWGLMVSLVFGELVDAGLSTVTGALLLGHDLEILFEFRLELACAAVAGCALRAGCGRADMDAGLATSTGFPKGFPSHK